MQRETHTIEIAGHKIELKTYLSYDESEAALKIEDKFEQTGKLIESAIVSLDGDPTDAYKRLRALPLLVYSGTAEKVSELVSAGFQKEK